MRVIFVSEDARFSAVVDENGYLVSLGDDAPAELADNFAAGQDHLQDLLDAGMSLVQAGHMETGRVRVVAP